MHIDTTNYGTIDSEYNSEEDDENHRENTEINGKVLVSCSSSKVYHS